MTKHALSIQERLDAGSMPEPNTGCILWFKGTSSDGYGALNINGKYFRAHRLSWIEANGPIPPGPKQCVCHKCDTPQCINPDHLWLGSKADNSADRDNKKRNYHGEEHHMSKLSSCKILEVIALYDIRNSEGKRVWTMASLAEKFNTSISSVGNWVQGKFRNEGKGL